ncbi:general substrate transporter [Aspergillus pseudoustus]|uniref:General substrate transporter n=1 Tax=Aspergillus pseudoustus TaxID=1810923 RepID=A0ABR4ISH2_9EURO
MSPTSSDTGTTTYRPMLSGKEDEPIATGAEFKHSSDPPQVISAFTTLNRSQALRKFWRLFALGASISVSGMYIGYAQSISGSIVANQGFIDQFATVNDPATGLPALDANHVSLWGALTFVGQIVVQFCSGPIADRWGRKVNMWLLQLVLVISIITAIVAKDWRVYTVSRLFSGFSGGFIGTSIMVYLSEMSLPQFRGTLLSSFALSMTLGQLFLAIGLKVLDATDPLNYVNMFYAELIFMGLWMFPLLFLPDSPAWYAGKGRHEEGKKALRRLIGNVEGYDVDHEYAVVQQEVEESLRQTRAQASISWVALTKRPNLRRLFLCAMPLVFQTFSGTALVFGFSTYFFAIARVQDPFLGALILQSVVLLGNLTSFYFIDKLGRRVLFIGGSILMCGAQVSMGGMAWLDPNNVSTGVALIAVCCVWAFVYANSLGPLGWISLVELSTPSLRAKTAVIGTILQSCTMILFSYTVPLMLSNQGANWGSKIGLFYGGLIVLYTAASVFIYPEAKGRTYQELDELFERGVPAWRFASTKTSHQTDVETTV